MIRKVVRDESGMTMALAMMMIVLISVMGAGILTFASRDLNTVVEENRGQRAFELAEAGVGAAKQQLSSDCGSDATACATHYDGGDGDIQWSASQGGLTLEDLDGEDPADRVNVTIEPIGTDSYKVISTGTYGDLTPAKRIVEAIFKGESDAPIGGEGFGHPIYYTPSSIQIEGPFSLNQISLFSEKDILIRRPGEENPLLTPEDFRNDYDTNNTGTLRRAGGDDELKGWDTMKAPFDPTGHWNTIERLDLYHPNGRRQTISPWEKPGYAALEKICGYQVASGDCAGSPSIADGVYSYDSTTGPNGCSLDENGNPIANPNYFLRPPPAGSINPWPGGWTFCNKPGPTYPDNVPGTLSFPFPRATPKAMNLEKLAKDQEADHYKDPTDNPSFYKHYWDVGTQGPPDWDALIPACPPDPVTGAAQNCYDRVVFVDADHTTLHFQENGNRQGVLVVWCGRFEQESQFQGIILNLIGDGSGFGASSCTADEAGFPGTYRNAGNLFQNNALNFAGWLYAEGGTDSKAGVELGPNSTIGFLPGGDWDLLNDVLEYQGAPPTTFKLQSWREHYQDAP